MNTVAERDKSGINLLNKSISSLVYSSVYGSRILKMWIELGESNNLPYVLEKIAVIMTIEPEVS